MKNLISFLFFLSICLTSLAQPQVSIVNSSTSTLIVPDSIFQGYFFIEQSGILVNMTDNSIISLPVAIPSGCTGVYVITSTEEIWCLGEGNNNYLLQLINYLEGKITSQYTLPISDYNNYNVGLFVSYDIIIVREQEKTQYKFVTFNATSQSYICNQSQAYFPGLAGAPYFGQDTLMWLQKSSDQYNYTSWLASMPCGSKSPISTILANNTNEIFKILAFNQSSFYVAFYSVLIQSGTQNVVTPFTLNSNGVPTFGPTINCIQVSQINDTYMVLTQGELGFLEVTIGVIDENLEYMPWSTWFSTLNASSSILTHITEGSLNVTVDLNATNAFSRFVFDFNIGGITYVVSDFPPIQLNNGSWIQMSGLGTFLKRNDKIDYTYNFLPINAYLYKTSENGIVWGLFVPFGEYNYYLKCSLITININASTLNQTFFSYCPTTVLSKSINLLDVAYNAEGQVTIAYRDSVGSLYIVNATNAYGPYTMTRLYVTPSLSLNLLNSTATFAGSQWLTFAIITFDIFTGQVYQKTNVPSEQQGYGTFMISPNYVLLGTANNKATVVEVWDFLNHTKVYQDQFDFATGEYYALDYIPGFAPSLLLISGYDIYVINSQKQITQIKVNGNNWETGFQVLNSNAFYYLTNNYNFYFEQVYNISSWYAGDSCIEVSIYS